MFGLCWGCLKSLAVLQSTLVIRVPIVCLARYTFLADVGAVFWNETLQQYTCKIRIHIQNSFVEQ